MVFDAKMAVTIALIAFGVMLLHRYLLQFFASRAVSRRYEQELHEVLHKDEYKVKGKFE